MLSKIMIRTQSDVTTINDTKSMQQQSNLLLDFGYDS